MDYQKSDGLDIYPVILSHTKKSPPLIVREDLVSK